MSNESMQGDTQPDEKQPETQRAIIGGAIAGFGGAIIAVVVLLSSGIRGALPWDFAGAEPLHMYLTCPPILFLGSVIGVISTVLTNKMFARYWGPERTLGFALLMGFLASAIIIFLSLVA